MANALYDKAREAFLSGSINMTTDVIKAALVTSGYTAIKDLAAHDFLADIAGNTIGTDQTLTGKTITGGVFDADNPTFATIAGGSTVDYVLLYKFVTNAADSPLIALIDTGTGLPLATNGGDIVITWDNGANKIFKL